MSSKSAQRAQHLLLEHAVGQREVRVLNNHSPTSLVDLWIWKVKTIYAFYVQCSFGLQKGKLLALRILAACVGSGTEGCARRRLWSGSWAEVSWSTWLIKTSATSSLPAALY